MHNYSKEKWIKLAIIIRTFTKIIITFFWDGVGVSNLTVFQTGILFDVSICTDNASLNVTTSKREYNLKDNIIIG